jgi:hypothetical protein
MRNKVTIFVGEQELDVFQDEDITINLSVQNIQDISKVFTDFTQGFSVPASPRNNAIFEHYYRTDIVGGADYRLRADGRIEINGLVFRYGSIELEGVQMRKNAPYAYDITFYGLLVNLTDIFGEDYLYDLEGLSAYNLDYTPNNVYAGLVSLTLDSIVFPLITAKDVWFYESNTSNNDPNNIYFHSINQTHGVQYYDLKPAIEINKVVDAIEDKYGITINVSGINDYNKLHIWCHRNAGYMYKDLPTSMPWTKVLAPDEFAPVTTDYWDYSDSTFNPVGPTGSGIVWQFVIDIDVNGYASDYIIGIFVDEVLVAQQTRNGDGQWTFNDINITNGSKAYFAIKPSTNESVTLDVVEVLVSEMYGVDVYANAYNSASQQIFGTIDIPSLMPEQKVTDFLASLCKMFNLVIVPVSDTEFDLLPLDEWYGDGTDVDLSQYFDITESQVERPQLYKQINFKYNETGAITGEEYRLTNDVGYGDLRSNFVFDTDEELAVEPQFDQMLFTRLTDQDGGALTKLLAGYAITRELETYLGQPFIFYVNSPITINPAVLAFIDPTQTIISGHKAVSVTQVVYANASNQNFNDASTYSLNYGADIDPYLLQSVNNSLYNTYWSDYITDLYNPSRRLVRVPAILPLGKILNFDLKNKLIWNGQRWLVNNVTINLTTGKAEFELLNNV